MLRGDVMNQEEPPLWSWEVIKVIPATRHKPTLVVEQTYHRGEPHSINEKYVLPYTSKLNCNTWRPYGRQVDTPSPFFAPLLLGAIVLFWICLYTQGKLT
tara:strand:+ start:26 stop:325 length:300 start_codon:yes stop_codon:yes gene_type:complete